MYLLVGLNIYMVLAVTNVFISGNLDLIFSEILVALISFTAINWLSRLTLGVRFNVPVS